MKIHIEFYIKIEKFTQKSKREERFLNFGEGLL